ncbi:type VI secretion system tube protein Hcp [Vitiosangium sp. GDMCC 1.1324]|uniref:Hcp family type VI secretion system effector n=1 Tax=Vitiosangium sp. (strain GDMCC 1.1324) TaxID=2138576 RepID=UPI000D3AC917|nr:type VI secretion system tube protein Hcp [Vitiosangium sp. GDMCC 1.1324]PTL82650.1 hypothetical protein DAT35_17825 [Vitiosangium sp. GDMCC 1.1324]
MASSIYLKIAKAEGSSQTDKFKDQIEVLSYRYEIAFPMTLNERSNKDGGIVRQGRSDHGQVVITKHVDKASPNLFLSCCVGDSVGNATLTVSGSKDKKIFTYEMTDVIITSVAVGGGGSDDPVETVKLDYGTIKWAQGESNSTKWDRKKNEST